MHSRHYTPRKSHASRHHRPARPEMPRPAARATAAEIAGVTTAGGGLAATLREVGEESKNQAMQCAEEALLKIPKPMLVGLGAGLLAGGAAGYFLSRYGKADSHAVAVEKERETPATRMR